MQSLRTTSLPAGFAAKVVTRSELQNSDAWQRPFQNKCKDHRFYDIVEDTSANNIQYRYWLQEDSDGNPRAIQPMFFARQNLIEGVPGKVRSLVEFIQRKFPRFLTMRVLMVGCAAGEGHLGVCDPKDEASVARALHRSLRVYARQNKAALVVLKDFPAKYRTMLSDFSNNGYARVPSMPMTRLSL